MDNTSAIENKVNEWLKWDKNDTTLNEIKEHYEKGNIEYLGTVLLHRQVFGTAGIRAKMGAGYNCLNDLVIIQTSQGLAKYLISTCSEAKSKGVVVAFDNRYNSERFAHLTAAALLQCGIRVYMMDSMCPTPFVPFSVLHFNCAAGIMVTASHNPKEDNGYKVYWVNGAQIISPHDKGIQKSIENNLEPWEKSWDVDFALTNPLLSNVLREVCDNYFTGLCASMMDISMNKNSLVTFTVTAMHGVSHKFMVEAFSRCGFKPFIPVQEQMEPDPEFPTVKYPNPEEGKSALDLSFKTANENDSHIILANDPDADRMAVAEKLPNNSWKVFTGNEIGGLLGWWLWQRHKKMNPDISSDKVYMISSTVSSKILKAIADEEGFNFIDTLTGFKWMGNKTSELRSNGMTVLLAFEEAIGFMCRPEYPTSLGNGKFVIENIRDLTTGYDSSQPDKKAILPTSSSSQMITFHFNNGCVLTCRTSGTEPKVKYYSEMCAKPGQNNWSFLEDELNELVLAFIQELMQPEQNGLIPRLT